jgi:hypothetical protein
VVVGKPTAESEVDLLREIRDALQQRRREA